MATKLVGYDSGDDSETQEESPAKRPRNEFVESRHSDDDEGGRKRQIEADFASEWESFEKLIQDGGSSPTAVPSVAIKAGLDTKAGYQQYSQSPAASSAANKQVVRPKRTFTEEVDSDHSRGQTSSEERSSGNRARKSSQGSVSSGKASSVSSRSSVHSSNQNVRSVSNDSSSDDEEMPKKTSHITEIQEERHSSDMSCDTSSDDDSDGEQHKNPVITSIPLSRSDKPSESATSESRPTRSSTDSKGERRLSDEKPSKPAESEDRIRAKLLAIAEQPVTDIRGSRSRSRERIASTHRRRSPSPRPGGKLRRGRAAVQHGRNIIRRSRSRSRHRRRSHEHEHRRGRSRSNDRRKRHRDHLRRRSRDRHSSPRRDRVRSRDRRRSRSRSPPKPKPQPMNFKEQLKAQILSVATAAEATAAAATTATADVHKPGFSADASKSLITANEKPSHLPLNTTNPLAAAIAAASAYSAADKVTPQQALAQTMAAIHQKVTPQQALMQTMAAVHQKAQELTGVAVPSYYNPAAVNPLKYAEQLKKRKLLWSKPAKETAEKEKESETKTAQSVAQWTGSSFAADSDGKMAAKFCKLMGIREQDKSLLSDDVDMSKLTEEQRKRQVELFEQLDKEYEFARMTTHTRRGVGLGFGSSSMPDMP